MFSGTTLYSLYSIISVLFSSLLAYLFWKRRSTIGALPMSLLMLSAVQWTVCDLLSVLSSSFESKVFFGNLVYLGVVSIPVLWFIFSIHYTRQDKILQKRHCFYLYIIPIITLVMIFSNNFHNLFSANTRIVPLKGSSISLVDYDFRAWFWVHTAYSYILIISGIVIMIKKLISFPKVYRNQVIILLIAVLIPFIGACLFLLGLTPSEGFDTTTFNFSITALLFFIGMFRYKVLDLVPIARESIIETMNELVIVLDTKNRIVDINNSARNILYERHNVIIGQPIGLVLKELLPYFEDGINKLKETEKIILNIENSERYYNMKVSYLLDKKRNVVGTVLDLSDITDLETAMQKLEESKLLAEKANKSKSEFLAAMSHEIRTPLNGIIGMAELLEGAPLGPQEKENLSALQYSSDSLLQIINKILDFSKIEAGKMEVENISFNIRELLFNISKTFSFNKKIGLITFTYYIEETVPEVLLGDACKLRQILNNIISNAFKFTEKGKIQVKVATISATNDMSLLEFSILDTGIGIDDSNLSNVFQSFHQLDHSTTRKYGGTGLGLSIVKSLVELMGGFIKVESNIGVGSTFTFQVPFKIEKNITSVEALNVIDTYSNKIKLNILVAEDSKVNQLLMSQFLKKKNWEVDIVANGRQVLEKLQFNSYDLILMDIQMPEMDGYETTIAIREQEKTSGNHIPIIALTANATIEDRDKCLHCGMDDFLSKPIKSEKLYSCILSATNFKLSTLS